jgi:hypothetical protein
MEMFSVARHIGKNIEMVTIGIDPKETVGDASGKGDARPSSRANNGPAILTDFSFSLPGSAGAHTRDYARQDSKMVDILLIPGGVGTRALVDNQPVIDFLVRGAPFGLM